MSSFYLLFHVLDIWVTKRPLKKKNVNSETARCSRVLDIPAALFLQRKDRVTSGKNALMGNASVWLPDNASMEEIAYLGDGAMNDFSSIRHSKVIIRWTGPEIRPDGFAFRIMIASLSWQQVMLAMCVELYSVTSKKCSVLSSRLSVIFSRGSGDW